MKIWKYENKYNTPNSAFARDCTKSINWTLAHSRHSSWLFEHGGCLQGAPNLNLSFEILPLYASIANFCRSDMAFSMAGLTTVIYNKMDGYQIYHKSSSKLKGRNSKIRATTPNRPYERGRYWGLKNKNSKNI